MAKRVLNTKAAKALKKALERMPEMLSHFEFSRPAPPVTLDQLDVMEQFLCLRYFPPEYRAFLELQNGGDPKPAMFKWRHSTLGDQEAHLDRLLGLDTRSPSDLSRSCDCIRMTLQCRMDLPPWAIAIGFVDSEDVLMIFEEGPREGQVWIKYGPEAGSEAKNGSYPVANSFFEFIEMLHASPADCEPATFALDGENVQGSQLESLLEDLGCIRHTYPGVVSQIEMPPTWRWNKYRSFLEGDRVWLKVEKNKTSGYSPSFDEWEVGHPMLRVNVTPEDAVKCLGELTSALGEGAVLLEGVHCRRNGPWAPQSK